MTLNSHRTLTSERGKHCPSSVQYGVWISCSTAFQLNTPPPNHTTAIAGLLELVRKDPWFRLAVC